MEKKQMSKNLRRVDRNKKKRKELWPEVEPTMIWKKEKGYTSIPRTLPYFLKIMDDLTKGMPVSKTYFTLWCHLWDESGLIKMVNGNNPDIFALESGFSGQRAVLTWRNRIKKLSELGFIKNKPLGAEEFGYILILNPYYVIKKLCDDKVFRDEGLYNALMERTEYIGAVAFNEEEVDNDGLAEENNT